MQPVLFQPQAFGEEAGNQVLTGLALSWLFLTCVFIPCLLGEWKAFLCMLLLQAGLVRFQLGHCWCACSLLLFIWGVGTASEPTGCALCKQKEPQQLLRPPSPPRRAPRSGGKLTHVQLFWKEGYFKGLEALVRLEFVCSLGRLGLQEVFDSGRAFLSSSLPACQPFTKAQDNEGGPRHPDVSPGSLPGPTWTASGLTSHSCSPQGCVTVVSIIPQMPSVFSTNPLIMKSHRALGP